MIQTPPPAAAPPPARKRTHPLVQALAGLLAAGVLLAVFGNHDNASSTAAAPTAAVTPDPEVATTVTHATTATPGSAAKKTMKETSFGCVTPEAFHDASSYWLNQEKPLMAQMFDSGQCELLKKGETVILVDVKFMEYAVVRRPGEATKLVTFQSVFD
jgi:hypothetical protein